jgi:hypothetical protein
LGCWFRFRRFDNRLGNRFDGWFGRLGWYDHFHFVAGDYSLRELLRRRWCGRRGKRLHDPCSRGFGDFGRGSGFDWRRVVFFKLRQSVTDCLLCCREVRDDVAIRFDRLRQTARPRQGYECCNYPGQDEYQEQYQ